METDFWSINTLIQLGYTVWVNQIYVLEGLAFGFSAVTVPNLESPEAPFKCTLDELGWIVSSLSLTAPIGCISNVFIMDRIGRSWALVLCLVPTIIGWAYMLYARSASDMIMGRLITGIGVGMSCSPPRTFVTEITMPSVRGVAGVITNVSLSLGIAIEGMLGKSFRFQTLCFINAFYATWMFIFNFFLPETPHFVLMNGDEIKTKKQLRLIRRRSFDVDSELEVMQRFIQNNNIRKLPTKQVFFKLLAPYVYKPFCIILVYITVAQLSGISIMIFWTIDILKGCRLPFDPYTANIILGVTRLVAGVVTSVLIHLLPRRTLAIIPAISIGFICIILGIFIGSEEKPTVFLFILLSIYMAMASVCYYSLPQLMLYEMVPLEIRGLLGEITDSIVFLVMFLLNKAFPVIVSAIKLPLIFTFFGVSSILGSFFLYIFLPETKGVPLQNIEESFRGKHLFLGTSAEHSIRSNSSSEHPRETQSRTSAELKKSKESSTTSEQPTHGIMKSDPEKPNVRKFSAVTFKGNPKSNNK